MSGKRISLSDKLLVDEHLTRLREVEQKMQDLNHQREDLVPNQIVLTILVLARSKPV